MRYKFFKIGQIFSILQLIVIVLLMIFTLSGYSHLKSQDKILMLYVCLYFCVNTLSYIFRHSPRFSNKFSQRNRRIGYILLLVSIVLLFFSS